MVGPSTKAVSFRRRTDTGTSCRSHGPIQLVVCQFWCLTWGSDGFSVLTTDSSGGWGAFYLNPLTPHPIGSWTGRDTFQGTQLGVAWEWNHNPGPNKYTVDNGRTLSTATITDDLFHPRNTLTHRLHGQFPVGTVAAAAPIMGHKVSVRVSLDTRASGTKLAQFYYSDDGSSFTQLGPSAQLSSGWQIFMGCDIQFCDRGTWRTDLDPPVQGRLGGSTTDWVIAPSNPYCIFP